MQIIKEKNFNKLKEKIKSLKGKQEIVFTSDIDDLNQKVLEKIKINILLINQKNKKDYQKQRNSGFNQVMAKLAKKNKIKIGINLDEIIEEKNLKNKSQILARIKQNIKICNKNKLQMTFIAENKSNSRDKKDIQSLGLILGIPTNIVKNL